MANYGPGQRRTTSSSSGRSRTTTRATSSRAGSSRASSSRSGDDDRTREISRGRTSAELRTAIEGREHEFAGIGFIVVGMLLALAIWFHVAGPLGRGIEVPQPPFWGARTIEHVPVKALLPYLNEQMLYQFHWGYEKQGRKLEDFLAWAQKELRPVLSDLVAKAAGEDVFAPKAAYGYWPAAAEGNDVVLFDESFAFQDSRARWLYTGITRAAKRLTVVV